MSDSSSTPDLKGQAANRPPAQWLETDPPLDAPHQRASTYAAALSGDRGWDMVGASRRGRLHAHEGTFREDAFRIDEIAGWSLIAVADGAGSHFLSRVGSDEAVTAAMAEMAGRLAEAADRSEPALRRVLEEALRSSWKALQRKAQELNAEFRDLGTTLLLLAYHPEELWAGIAQIGDGLLAAQLEGGAIQLFGQPESGEYSGQTLFLTNHKEEELASRVEITTITGTPRLFLVMTDGVADDFYPPQERLPGLIQALPAVLAGEERATSLLNLINYERAGSFDDRTLVILVRQGALSGSKAPGTETPVENPSEGATDGNHAR